MNPRITSVSVVGSHSLRLTFSDGLSGEVDLSADVVGRGGVFTPLEDPRYFRSVELDTEAGTIVWRNGVDLDPDVLYHRVSGRPLPGAAEHQSGHRTPSLALPRSTGGGDEGRR